MRNALLNLDQARLTIFCPWLTSRNLIDFQECLPEWRIPLNTPHCYKEPPVFHGVSEYFKVYQKFVVKYVSNRKKPTKDFNVLLGERKARKLNWIHDTEELLLQCYHSSTNLLIKVNELMEKRNISYKITLYKYYGTPLNQQQYWPSDSLQQYFTNDDITDDIRDID